MHIVIFAQSFISDWNHGNAHFLRGVVNELQQRGHKVTGYEPKNSWSLANLIENHGYEPVRMFHEFFPDLVVKRYDLQTLDLDKELDDADLVMVHEWNDHELVKRIGNHRKLNTGYKVLFHDTHHRSVTDPESMQAYDLSYYDGVLAFGEIVRSIYLARSWIENAWTWHEAADTRLFRPLDNSEKYGDVIWIGNWGDNERTEELRTFLFEPIKELQLSATVHGVRYPLDAREFLSDAGMSYAGWIPNYKVPQAFSRYKLTVHIPRRPYVEALRGIPTIRPFEALACGIPLLCSPWYDSENMFTEGKDYLTAHSSKEMIQHLRNILNDEDLARELSACGRNTILKHHTCRHRVDELLNIAKNLGVHSSMEHSMGSYGKQ